MGACGIIGTARPTCPIFCTDHLALLARSGLEVLDMVEEGHEIWCVVRKGEHGTHDVPAATREQTRSSVCKHVRSTAIPHAIQRLRWAVGRRLGRAESTTSSEFL